MKLTKIQKQIKKITNDISDLLIANEFTQEHKTML